MKVLFLESHPLWVYGLPNGFLDAGHEVKVSGRLNEQKISSLISEFKPDLVITMGWTDENNSLNKIDWIRNNVKANNIPLVYWATEDPTHTDRFSKPLIERLQPDFVLTICKDKVEFYNELGIPASQLDFGYHQFVHHPTILDEGFKYNIVVVANGYPNNLKNFPDHYRIKSINNLIAPLIKRNIRVDFFGNDWDKMGKFIGKPIPKEWIHGSVPYIFTNDIYSSADIVIGLQNHETQLTQRTYEVLGSGGFLLTNDTLEIRRLFTPGKDLSVSSSPEETIELVRHYLKNKKIRDEIRNNGLDSVKPHNYKYRAEYMVSVLKDNKIIK